jgi:hypothetical protein
MQVQKVSSAALPRFGTIMPSNLQSNKKEKKESYVNVIQLHQNNNNDFWTLQEDGDGGGLRNGLSSINHHKIVAGEER